MRIARWIMLHSEVNELVRVNIDNQDLDHSMNDLPEPVQAALRTGRDALLEYLGAVFYEPPAQPSTKKKGKKK